MLGFEEAGADVKYLWLQPNRTEDEKAHKNKINCFLSWLHRVLEYMGLDKQWMRRAYLSSLAKGQFQGGQ